jgi:histidyl-tRNA synthetase
MNQKIMAPKGIPEYIAPESAEFLAVRTALAQPAQLAGYGYIELPVYEDTSLYIRGVGESTDVVSKEMFSFTDRGDRSITLRPEGTAGVMRAVIEHGLDRGQLPIKLWYAGPFFRAERPQAGRYRQLQQVGVEAIGSDDPALDAEVIALADEGYRRLGLTEYTLKLNSLGCANCRPAYREQLTQFLSKLDLDEATSQRAVLNPLRVLDDKRAEIQAQLENAPLQVNALCSDCTDHYDQTREFLKLQKVKWEEAPRMVRGLDYYNRTTFEFDHPRLGAQSGIGGGGRYDGLMSDLGGAALSGIGFGLGTDRTLLACRAEGLEIAQMRRVDVYLVPLGSDAKRLLVTLGAELRAANISNEMSFGDRGLKAAMKSADKFGARFAVLLGEDEVEAGTAVIKDLHSSNQQTIAFTDLEKTLTTLLEEK